MYCKNLSRSLNGKLRCKISKQQVILEQCKKCLKFNPRVNKAIKKKSSKLKKIEKERFSILTDNLEKCYYCSRKANHIHEIYKGSNRLISMKNGFCIPLCWECHKRTEDDVSFLKKFQFECQEKYLENHTKEELLKKVGKIL